MCGVDICPVHTRTDVKDPVEANVPARAITYVGEYAVATLDNPEFGSPMAALKLLLGGEVTPPDMFMHLVVKVGSGALGDVLDRDEMMEATVFRQTFLAPDDERLDETAFSGLATGDSTEFNAKLTEIMHEAHEMVLSSVKDGTIPA